MLDPSLSEVSETTLADIAVYALEHNDAVPSAATLAEIQGGILPDTAAKRIAVLFRKGYFIQIRRGVYRINDEAFCTKEKTAKLLLELRGLAHSGPKVQEVKEAELIEQVLPAFAGDREAVMSTIDGCCKIHYLERNSTRTRDLRGGALLESHLGYLEKLLERLGE